MKTMNTYRKVGFVVILGATICLSGCLKRKETIVVNSDGSFDIHHQIKGDVEDMETGAAKLPGSATGFVVKNWVSLRIAESAKGTVNGRPLDRKKNTEHVHEATAHFDNAAMVPTSYLASGTPLAEAALRFTTELEVVEEKTRTIYRFTRRYFPRKWANYDTFWRRSFAPDLQELMDSDKLDWKKLDQETRRRFVAAMVDWERAKITFWATEALSSLKLSPRDRADLRMNLHADLKLWTEQEMPVQWVKELMNQGDDRIEDETRKVHRRVLDFLCKRIKDFAKAQPAALARFLKSYALARREYDVTEDLNDEDFVVEVKMPGTILRHNGRLAGKGLKGWSFTDKKVADRIRRSLSGKGILKWSFNHKDLRDRIVLLEAVSVVEKQPR